jgi:hypothetical protein
MRVFLCGAALVAVIGASSAATVRSAETPPSFPTQAASQAQSPAPEALSDAQIEQFLRSAKIVRTKDAGKGVTGSIRATLSDGTLTHDAQIQTIDDRRTMFDAPGAVEFNFQDSWKFNVAAYRLDRLIGLGMVPVTVSRMWKSSPAAFTWWIDDVAMDEGKRLKDKIQPPDTRRWNEQMQLVRVFDQLIYNVDRNGGNLLIGKTWRVWAIDHTRAFRTDHNLKAAANITRCDRQVLAKLKGLTRESLHQAIGEFVSKDQIDGLLARRDKIVAIVEGAGPSAVFDRQAH